MNKEEQKLFIGKKIKNIVANGCYVEIVMEDNTKFTYNATDGGYSTYEISKVGDIE